MSEYKELMHEILFIYVNKMVKDLTVSSNTSISINMFSYLDTIHMAKSITPSMLAEKMGVSRPASTKMLKKLVKLELVKKNDIGNSKTYTVSLTDKAIEIYKISKRMDAEFIGLLDKYLDLKRISNIDKKLQSLLNEYKKI